MYSQRKKERRSFSSKTSFPLVTNGGHLVENDRRNILDRRMGYIHLELIDAVNHGFSERPTTTLSYSSGKEDYR